MISLNYVTVLIQCQMFKLYREYHKKHKTLNTNPPPTHIYINTMNNGGVFKIKDGYKLVIQASEMMKLFGSKESLKSKTNSGENMKIS